MWSFIIGGAGLVMPLVVPPIREAMGYGTPQPKSPPPVRQVGAGAHGHGNGMGSLLRMAAPGMAGVM